MKTDAYTSLVQKQAAISELVAGIASANRAPSEAETKQLETLKSEVAAIRESFESAGRNAFLSGLRTERKAADGPTILKAANSFAQHVKASGDHNPEHEGLSLGKILRGYVLGDWDGARLERKALSETPSSAGGVLVPTPLAAQVIDLARNQARVMQAGAVVVPMESATLKMARLASDISAGWTSEAANITADAATNHFESITFTARKLAALVAIDNELLLDAGNADSIIEASIAKAIGLALDYAALFGSGTAPQPAGLHGAVPSGAAVSPGVNYDPYLTGIAAIRSANFTPNAILYSARTAGQLAALKAGVSATDMRQLPQPKEFAELQQLVTNQIPNNLGTGTNESQAFIGQWDQLAIGMRNSLQIEVSREASYYDGSAQQSAFSRDQTVVRAILRADIQPLHLPAFYELSGIKL